MTAFSGQRFAVVGGGISGMATALLLARHGRDVTLIEKKKVLGTTLRGFSRQGIRFDTGLHYAGGLSPDGPLTRYFRFLGLENLPLAPFNPDCFDRIRFLDTGREICLPVGKEAFIDALCAAFPTERAFIRSYIDKLSEGFAASSFLNFGADWQKLASDALHDLPLTAVLERGTQNGELRAVLSAHCLLYGVSPHESPFIQHARVAGSYIEGVATIRGGGKALVIALEERLARAGVTVIRGSAVTGMHHDAQKGITGLLLEDDRLLPCDGVIFTAHPAHLPGLLPQGAVKPAFTQRLRALEDTLASYSLFCASKIPIPLLQGSNLFLCPGTEITAGFCPEAQPWEGPFYVAGNAEMPSSVHGFIAFAPGSMAELAPWEHSISGNRPAEYTAFKQQKLAAMHEALVKACPEIRQAAVLEGGTPLTNRDFLDSPNGGLYGAKHSLWQFSPLPVTRIPNLWMAGQSVIAPGLLGAIISGVVACGCILGMEAMHKEIAACR